MSYFGLHDRVLIARERNLRAIRLEQILVDMEPGTKRFQCSFETLDRVLLACVIEALVIHSRKTEHYTQVSALGHPAPESEPARKEEQPSDQTVEQVEGADSGHTDEEEQRSFYPEVREGLVQALIDSGCAPISSVCLHRCPSRRQWLMVEVVALRDQRVQIPQSQVRTFVARTAMPVPAATPARVFFAPGSP